MGMYIGARYTIKVYENSVDPSSAEWEADVQFEPLTLTTYNNSSYLSKKQVPASVGNPAANPYYWAVTGYYNGQIAHLQNEIDDINDELRPLNDKHILLMGDSYARGTVCTHVNPDEYTHNIEDGWAYKVQNMLGLDNVHCQHIATGGASFAQPNTPHWQDTIATATITDADKIDEIILCGGANDRWASSYSDIVSGIEDFFDAAHTRCPNAKISIGMVCGGVDTGVNNPRIRKVFNAYSDGAIDNGGSFISGLENVLNDRSLLSADGVHPTADGYTVMARQIANCISGRSTDTIAYNTLTIDPATGVTISNSVGLRCGSKNDFQYIDIGFLSLTVSVPTMKFDRNLFFKIGTLQNTCITGGSESPFGPCAACNAVVKTSTTNHNLMGRVTVIDSDIYFSAMAVDEDSGAWLELTDVNQIILCGIHIVSNDITAPK